MIYCSPPFFESVSVLYFFGFVGRDGIGAGLPRGLGFGVGCTFGEPTFGVTFFFAIC